MLPVYIKFIAVMRDGKQVAVYLAGDASDYMTGEIVYMDGGQANYTA